ncbi:hypothetical protein KBD81_00145 [Candidatus Woesebacteria bacterium]|nr:hypothetical protein [Candidatus Woesebacteria bacterium]
MSYYDELQYIAHVDAQDVVLEKVERWDAHKKGILHRAITVAVYYQDFAILQHRKHPVFDNVFDLSVSSHQIFTDTVEDDYTTIYRTLQRELGISETDLEKAPILRGSIVYKAKDPHSEYTEHEVCHIYTCRSKQAPKINLDFAYGYSLQKMEAITNNKSPLYAILAPWVREMINHNMI